MTAPKQLTRKLGPLPVYGWALLALAGTFLYLRSGRTASASTPVMPAVGSAAQQPASGQGSPADNMGGDLLGALGQQQTSYDAMLAALQGYGGSAGSGGSGGAGVPSGFGGGGGSDTSSFTAATIDSGTNNAPAPTQPIGKQDVNFGDPAPLQPPDLSSVNFGAPAPSQPPDLSGVNFGSPTLTQPPNLSDVNFGSQPVTSPTPIEVQPAPVDTSPTLKSGNLTAA